MAQFSGAITVQYTKSGITLTNNGGVLNAGGVMAVDHLINKGTILVAGDGVIGETIVTGHLENHEGAVLSIDIDTDTPQADKHTIGGDATLRGEVDVQLSGAGTRPSGSIETFSAGGALGFSEINVRVSVVSRHELIAAGPNRLHLTYSIDFALPETVAALQDNQASLASHLDATYRAGALDKGVSELLISSDGIDDYGESLSNLGVDLLLSNQISTLNSSRKFADSLFRCPNADTAVRYFDDGSVST